MFHLTTTTPPYLDLERLAAIYGDSHQLHDTLLALLESNSCTLPADSLAGLKEIPLRSNKLEPRHLGQQSRRLATRSRPVTSCGSFGRSSSNCSLSQITMNIEKEHTAAAPPAPLRLQPNGLYLILSTRRTSNSNSDNHEDKDGDDLIDSIGSSSAPLPFRDQQDRRFKWGLYWSRAFGIGRSYRYRYCPRDETWLFEQDWYPSSRKPGREPIEAYERVVVALHIENMDEKMANRLGERLDAKHFLHSHSERRPVRSLSDGDMEVARSQELERLDRSRTWVGHALVLLNNEGFISLKDSSRGAGFLEKEVLAMAKENVLASPPRKTVERSENVIYDART